MSNKQLKNISDANLIEEGGHSVLVKRSVIFIIIMLLFFIVWSSLTKVDEVAVSFGDIQPTQDVQTIQYLEGGVVSKVMVKDTEEVKKGQVLLQMNPEAVNSELQKVQSKEISLIVNAERLNAFVQHTPDYKIDWLSKIKNAGYNTPENSVRITNLIKEGNNLLEQQNREREQQRKILSEEMAQKKAQLDQLIASKIDQEKQLVLYAKEEEMFNNLAPQGYVSKRDYLVAQRKTIEVSSKIKELEGQIIAAQSALIEARNQLTKLDSSFNKEALKELNQTNQELIEIQHTIQRLLDSSKRLTVITPVTGILKGLKALPGTVLSPGETIAEVVPTEGRMLVHCKISTRDIGYVNVGNDAEIKVMSYDFARYGSVTGKVLEISASTFMNKDGLPYYEAKVSLDKNYVGKNPKENILKPGMTVQVDIITGKKSIMSYILKPITRALDTSFKER